MSSAKSTPRKRAREDDEQDVVRCVCGVTEDNGDLSVEWICCDECNVWQHMSCVGIQSAKQNISDSYHCDLCDPRGFGRRTCGDEVSSSHGNVSPVLSDRMEDWNHQDGNLGNNDGQQKQAIQQEGTKLKGCEYPLTEYCQHYAQISEVPWDIQKYWHQRFSIFSRYNSGIYLTDDLWYGVTPEPVARDIAQTLANRTPSTKTTLIDLFAGAGGNIISFALSSCWTKIIAIEKSRSAIACAQHNAKIYGVADRITLINADCFSYLSNKLTDSTIKPNETVIFASPPWGGPGYRTDEVFNLDTMDPYPLKAIYEACKCMDLAVYLPRTSDLRQIAKFAPEGKKVDVVQMCMDGASKAMVAYIPAAATEEH